MNIKELLKQVERHPNATDISFTVLDECDGEITIKLSEVSIPKSNEVSRDKFGTVTIQLVEPLYG